MSDINKPINIPKTKIKLTKDKGLSEKQVEGNNRNYSKTKNVLFEKFVSPSKRSVPDDMLTFEYGLIAFIEYKAPGKFPTEKQWFDHCKRRDRGVLVYVVDDPDIGRNIIDKLIELDDNSDSESKAYWLQFEIERNRAYYTCQKIVER